MLWMVSISAIRCFINTFCYECHCFGNLWKMFKIKEIIPSVKRNVAMKCVLFGDGSGRSFSIMHFNSIVECAALYQTDCIRFILAVSKLFASQSSIIFLDSFPSLWSIQIGTYYKTILSKSITMLTKATKSCSPL